jgi:hypothetical protein
MTALLETAAPAPGAVVTPRRWWRSFLRHRMGLIGAVMLAIAPV